MNETMRDIVATACTFLAFAYGVMLLAADPANAMGPRTLLL